MKQKHRVRLSCLFRTKEYIKTSHLWQRNRPDWKRKGREDGIDRGEDGEWMRQNELDLRSGNYHVSFQKEFLISL